MIPQAWFLEAAERISAHIHITPLTHDPEHDLYLKWENHQVTGSFKARGAINKVLSLEKWEREAGILAASAGNHGQGVALAARLAGTSAKVFVGQTAPAVKIEAMRDLGADVVVVPGGYGEAENAALALAAKGQGTWVSAYNDGLVIAGQGTLGLETLEQLADFPDFELADSVWLVPTSGGGLTAGIAAVLANQSLRPKVVGIQTDTSPFMHAIFHQGSQTGVIERPTLADGLAGPVEEGSLTIPLIRQLVDDILLVSEAETAQAVALAWQKYGQRIEGSAAVTLAAILSGKIEERPAVLILSGGNIQEEVFQNLIADSQNKGVEGATHLA